MTSPSTFIIIPHCKPSITDRERAAVAEFLSQSTFTPAEIRVIVEDKLKKLTGRAYAHLVSSGTAAFHLAFVALGVGPNSVVGMPSYSCDSLLSSVLYCGAGVRFFDCSRPTGNLDMKTVDGVDVLAMSQMFGVTANLGFPDHSGHKVVEDFTWTIGGSVNGRPSGSFGVASVCSFHATKPVCGGEGGVFLTDDQALYEHVKDISDHVGKNKFALRWSYRMSALAMVLVSVQLDRLEEMIARRRAIAALYNERLSSLSGIQLPSGPEFFESTYSRYIAKSPQRDFIRGHLKRRGIASGVGVLNALHKQFGMVDGLCPVTEDYVRTSLSLPIYPDLTLKQAGFVSEIVMEAVNQ